MEILKLKSNKIKKAAEVVTMAFFDYPMFTHYFPDSKRRKQRMSWYMEKTLNCAIHYGEVFVTSDYSGIMFILSPCHTRLTNKEFIKNGFLFIPFVMGFRNYAKSNECEKFVADTHERLLNGKKHYYLWGLATNPNVQRKGVGSALLKALIDKADVENMPVYLETHDEKNVAYYERFGFRLIHKDTIPKHGLDIWCMLYQQ